MKDVDSPEALIAIRRLVKAKMELWNAGDALEEAIGSDIDTTSEALEGFASIVNHPDDIDDPKYHRTLIDLIEELIEENK